MNVSNREFSLAVRRLARDHHESTLPLESYLLSLWAIVTDSFRQRTSFSLVEFVEVLSKAFVHQPPAFFEPWRTQVNEGIEEPTTFEDWKSTIVSQIVDLREMDEAGKLENEFKSFGIDSPRNNRWYNFDPSIFLECAASGIAGYHEDDSDQGDSAKHDDSPTDCIEENVVINWGFFCAFLWFGQNYE